MGIVIRQSFWGSLITYLGVGIGYINSLVLLPYFLDSERYGLVRLIQSNGMILIPLAIIGMNGAYVKYFPNFKDNHRLSSRIFSFQLFVVITGSILFSLIIYFFENAIQSFYAENSSLYNDYLYVTVIIFVSQSLFNYFIAFFWSRHNIILPNFLNEIFLRLASTLIIVLYGFDYLSFPLMIFWIGMSYILTTITLYLSVIIRKDFKFDWEFYKIEWKWVRKLFGFGGYTMLITSCTSIVLNISYPLTSSFIGLEANAILTISVYIGTIIELPKRSMSQIISPIITQNFSDKNLSEISKNFTLASINLGLLSLLLGIGIITNIDSLFILIPNGEVYGAGSTLILIICVAKFINMLGGVSPEVINYSSFYRVNIFITVLGALLMVILNVLLIPEFGILGAGMSILITTAVNQIIRYVVIYSKLSIRPFEKGHLLMLVPAGISYMVAISIPVWDNPYWDIIIRSFVTSIAFLGITYFMKISDPLNQLILKTIESIRGNK